MTIGKAQKRPASKTNASAKILPSVIHTVFLRNTSVGRFWHLALLYPTVNTQSRCTVLRMSLRYVIMRRRTWQRQHDTHHTRQTHISLSWCIADECVNNAHNPILLGDVAMAVESCWDLVCTWIHRGLGRWSGVVLIVLGLWDTMTYR